MTELKDKATDLRAEIDRLRWLIEWVDENASFPITEWFEWEKRRDHPEPWLLDDGKP